MVGLADGDGVHGPVPREDLLLDALGSLAAEDQRELGAARAELGGEVQRGGDGGEHRAEAEGFGLLGEQEVGAVGGEGVGFARRRGRQLAAAEQQRKVEPGDLVAAGAGAGGGVEQADGRHASSRRCRGGAAG